MKQMFISAFNKTLGKIFRLVQGTLISEPTRIILHHLVKLNALETSAEFAIKNFSQALIFDSREKLWTFCIERMSYSQSEQHDSTEKREKVGGNGGLIAEFGVWKGESINFFAKKFLNSRIYDFDSFEGLEEDWYGFRLTRGTFSTNSRLPKVEPNVILIKGWFEETVPKFVKEIGDAKLRLIHMDADTYKPTLYVLRSIKKNLTRGSIIIFDEFFGSENYQLYEFKAWHDFIKESELNYMFIGYSEMQVAVQIL